MPSLCQVCKAVEQAENADFVFKYSNHIQKTLLTLIFLFHKSFTNRRIHCSKSRSNFHEIELLSNNSPTSVSFQRSCFADIMIIMAGNTYESHLFRTAREISRFFSRPKQNQVEFWEHDTYFQKVHKNFNAVSELLNILKISLFYSIVIGSLFCGNIFQLPKLYVSTAFLFWTLEG